MKANTLKCKFYCNNQKYNVTYREKFWKQKIQHKKIIQLVKKVLARNHKNYPTNPRVQTFLIHSSMNKPFDKSDSLVIIYLSLHFETNRKQ